MTLEKTLYTDGHEVTVTDSFFKVKKSSYQLNGITNHSMFIIHPHRVGPIIVLVLGIVMIIIGALHLIPTSMVQNIRVFSVELTADFGAVSLGIGLTLAGAILLSRAKDRYAIRIATAAGEKNVLVSTKKEYVNQILDALNHAFLNLVSPIRTSSQQVQRK